MGEELTRATIYTAQNAPKIPALEDLPLVEQVSQYGITWTFDRKVRAGRFIVSYQVLVGMSRLAPVGAILLLDANERNHPLPFGRR